MNDPGILPVGEFLPGQQVTSEVQLLYGWTDYADKEDPQDPDYQQGGLGVFPITFLQRIHKESIWHPGEKIVDQECVDGRDDRKPYKSHPE